jgi:exodeoxyribonuclease VII small subunit
MKAHSSQPIEQSPASFEASLQELERLVQTLENGGAPLEDALQAYEQGIALLKHCQSTLAQAEQKIRLLDGDRLTDFPIPADSADAGGTP